MKFKSCVDDYSPAPDDFPVWCVEAEATWQTGLQLLGEILLLVVLVYLAIDLLNGGKHVEFNDEDGKRVK